MNGAHPPEPHRLLTTLDELTRDDAGPVRLGGCVVVAVKSSSGASVWHAFFRDGRLMGCGFLDGVPKDADALLVVDAEQASSLVDGEAPHGRLSVFGDQALLDAFIARYCEFRSLVDVRSAR